MPQREIEIPTHKQMNMVWHDDITPNSQHFALVRETNQRVVHMSVREKLLALVGVERHKIQRRVVMLKYPVQTRWPVSHEYSVRCRGACARRPMVRHRRLSQMPLQPSHLL